MRFINIYFLNKYIYIYIYIRNEVTKNLASNCTFFTSKSRHEREVSVFEQMASLRNTV